MVLGAHGSAVNVQLPSTVTQLGTSLAQVKVKNLRRHGQHLNLTQISSTAVL